MKRRSAALFSAMITVLALTGCSEPGADPMAFVERPTQAIWDPADGDFWSLPIPSDLRRQADGSFDLEQWPGAQEDALIWMWLEAADRRLTGWGLSSAVTMTFSGPLDEASLPGDGAPTLEDEASVFLLDVDPASPERGQRLPIRPRWIPWESTYSPANALSAVPVWGFLRRPNTTYALVVTTAVLDSGGAPLGRSRAFHDAFVAADGADPASVEALLPLRDTLEGEGFDLSRVAAAAIFSTLDPSSDLIALVDWADRAIEPELSTPWSVAEDYESYQVLNATWGAPVIQNGARPYDEIGEGLIVRDDSGDPVVQEIQDVRLALTLPKQPMPAGGFPLVLYLHGSGGEWYQAINRGPQAEIEDAPDPEPGTGPAEWLARRGMATLGFDFPLHGDRSDPPDTTGLKLYNLLGNIDATVDNFQVAVAELTMISRLMLRTSVDEQLATTLDAGGAADGLIRFDPERLSGMGQSMGTTLGVPWLGVDPRVKGFVASGAGGILVELAVSAQEPFDIRPILAFRMGISPEELTEAHPMLNAFQNLWDLVDPIAKAPYATASPWGDKAPVPVLMTAGMRDGYFHPRAEAAMAVALGVTHVGEEVEPILPDALRLAGRDSVSYPLRGNLNGVTAAVVQYAAPEQQGHYVVFNQDGARYQYTCFLKSVGDPAGAVVSVAGGLDDACP